MHIVTRKDYTFTCYSLDILLTIKSSAVTLRPSNVQASISLSQTLAALKEMEVSKRALTFRTSHCSPITCLSHLAHLAQRQTFLGPSQRRQNPRRVRPAQLLRLQPHRRTQPRPTRLAQQTDGGRRFQPGEHEHLTAGRVQRADEAEFSRRDAGQSGADDDAYGVGADVGDRVAGG